MVKNLDLGVEQAWDQMLALPLQADLPQVKVLVLDFVDLPGSLKHFALSVPCSQIIHNNIWLKWILDDSAY